MTTRNIVPRTTEEGQLGTTSKKWSKGYFKELFMGSTPAKCSVEEHTHAQADVTNLVSALAGKASTAAATTTAAGLVELATDAEFDTGTDTARYASVAQIRKRVPLGFKNLLINGAFNIKQRPYASGEATTGANQYTLDRWRVVTSGEALSWTSSAGTVTVTAPAGGIEQVVEGATLQSGTYAISWTGTATCTVGGTARTSGEAFAVTGGSNVTVKFINGTVANAQLELGGCATPFERRPYGLELALCQRYFERISGLLCKNLAGFINSTTYARFPIYYSTKRAAPTITCSTAGDFSINANSSLFTPDTMVASYPLQCGALIQAISSGMTAGNGAALILADTSYIDISAEL